jgi:tight adherence protein B
MRRLLAALLVLLPVAIGWDDGSEPTVEFIDITAYPIVRLGFTPPAGLRADVLDESRVTLTQDDEPLTIAMRSLEQDPVEVVLLLDTSGSMAGRPLIDAAGAAREFIDRIPTASDIAVVTFGSEATVAAPFGSTRDEVLAAIAATTASGGTSMHDAVITAVDLLDAAPLTRQFMLLLSDGADTESLTTIEEAAAALEVTDVGLYVVALPGSEYDRRPLDALSTAAAGRVVEADDSEGLDDIYAEIADELSAQYAIAFEALHGGESTFTLTIEGPGERAEAIFTITLPADPTEPVTEAEDTDTGEMLPPPTTTSTTIRQFTSPSERVVEPVGPLGRAWAKWVGVGAFFIVLTIVAWLVIVPGEPRRRRGVFDGGHRRRDVTADRDPGRARRAIATLERVIGRVLERDDRRRGVARTLEAAGIPLHPGEFMLLALGGAAIGAIVGLLLGRPLVGLLIAAAVLAGSRVFSEQRARSRRARFDDQLESTLQLIAGSLRAGYGVTQAINTVATEAAEPTAAEFSRVVAEIRLGRDLIESLRSVADRMDNVDFVWVAEAIDIQQGVGGDLAQILDTVGSTIRDRNRIRRQVHALSAEGRMSAAILIGLPFAIAGLITITNPDYLSELTNTFAGRILLLVGAGLMAVGIAWIRKIIRIEY